MSRASHAQWGAGLQQLQTRLILRSLRHSLELSNLLLAKLLLVMLPSRLNERKHADEDNWLRLYHGTDKTFTLPV